MLNQRTIFTLTHSFGRLARQAAMCTAVAALTACGGGSGGNGDMIIMPLPVEPPNTLMEVISTNEPTEVGSPVQASLPPGEKHYFLFVLNDAQMDLRIVADGVEIKAFDDEGNMLRTRPGSIIVIVTDELIARGGKVIIEISSTSSTAAMDYVLRSTVVPPDPGTASSTLPTI